MVEYWNSVMNSRVNIAYFSMEMGLASSIPTYASGLGVLAGDTVPSAVDLGISMVAVSLLARKDHFNRKIDETGWQTEEPVIWSVDARLIEMTERASIEGFRN